MEEASFTTESVLPSRETVDPEDDTKAEPPVDELVTVLPLLVLVEDVTASASADDHV
jgi:hypothetical protein